MLNHATRLRAILAALAICTLGFCGALALHASAEVVTLFVGALTALVPATLDALRVEKRRKTPGKRAVEDEVR